MPGRLVAIPLFGTRVAPRCRHARELLVARIIDGRVVSKKVVPTMETSNRERLALLADMGVDTLVCSGLERDFHDAVTESGISVIENVVGEVNEVLAQLAAGDLKPWYGYKQAPAPDSFPAPPPPIGNPSGAPDCAACVGLECLQGQDCHGVRAGSLQLATREPVAANKRISAYVSGDCLGSLCRIEETIEYCTGMDYRNIGLAFCMDLIAELRTLASLLRRRFEVVAVGCKVGGMDRSAFGLPRMTTAPFEPACNPMGQALIFKKHHCDIILCVGLCVGLDIALQSAVSAPVTSLIVKDRLLANNPAAALHSQFHLRNITGGL